MTKEEFTELLDRLGMGTSTAATAQALGVEVRSVQRYADGSRPIPDTLVLLLRMYQAHGLPEHLLVAGEPPRRASFAKTKRRIPLALQTRRV